jgi:HSP20 family protein
MNLVSKDSLFGDVFDDFGIFRKSNSIMKSDIYEKDGVYTVEVDIPGFKKENVKVDYDDGYLKISGKREEVKEENTNYLHKERFSGEFSRSYYIGNIDESSIKAKFEDGTLKVTFPKEEPKDTTRQIPIE